MCPQQCTCSSVSVLERYEGFCWHQGLGCCDHTLCGYKAILFRYYLAPKRMRPELGLGSGRWGSAWRGRWGFIVSLDGSTMI